MKRVLRLHRAGKSVRAISRETGIPFETARRWIRQAEAKLKEARSNRCYTHPEIIEAVRDLCRALGCPGGQIPVDAASDADANDGIPGEYPGIHAARMFTGGEKDDGLKARWVGDDCCPSILTWMNPPFSAVDGRGRIGRVAAFVEAAERNLSDGSTMNVVMLLPLRVTHEWSDRIFGGDWTVCFIADGQHTEFFKPATGTTSKAGVHQTPLEIVVAYRGSNEDAFVAAFRRLGHIVPSGAVVPRR